MALEGPFLISKAGIITEAIYQGYTLFVGAKLDMAVSGRSSAIAISTPNAHDDLGLAGILVLYQPPFTMSISLNQAIHEQASDHTRLLGALEQLDYVPVALAQQTEYLKDLEHRLQESIITSSHLAIKVERERKEHEEFRDSTVRRLAHKLTGKSEKFAEQAGKEEREYVEALEQQMVEKQQEEQLRDMIAEAKRVIKALETKFRVHESLKVELNRLYNRVFEGPTPEHPEEDRLENDVWEAQAAHDKCQESINTESRAAELLAKADEHLASCSKKLNAHIGFQQSDIVERRVFSAVHSLARNAETLIKQAQSMSPNVASIPRNTSGSLLVDLQLHGIPDTNVHQRIKGSAALVNVVLVPLRAQQRAARQRADDAGAKLGGAAKDLAKARDALYEFRKATFQRVTTQDLPPSYAPPGPNVNSDPSSSSPPVLPEISISESFLMEGISSQHSPSWGNRNPYAAFLLAQTSTPNEDVEENTRPVS